MKSRITWKKAPAHPSSADRLPHGDAHNNNSRRRVLTRSKTQTHMKNLSRLPKERNAGKKRAGADGDDKNSKMPTSGLERRAAKERPPTPAEAQIAKNAHNKSQEARCQIVSRIELSRACRSRESGHNNGQNQEEARTLQSTIRMNAESAGGSVSSAGSHQLTRPPLTRSKGGKERPATPTSGSKEGNARRQELRRLCERPPPLSQPVKFEVRVQGGGRDASSRSADALARVVSVRMSGTGCGGADGRRVDEEMREAAWSETSAKTTKKNIIFADRFGFLKIIRRVYRAHFRTRQRAPKAVPKAPKNAWATARGCRAVGTARSLAGEGARDVLDVLQRESSAYKNGGWSYEGRDEVEREGKRPPMSDACSRDVVAGRSVHVPKRDGRRGRRDRHEPRRACVPSSLSIVRKRAGLAHEGGGEGRDRGHGRLVFRSGISVTARTARRRYCESDGAGDAGRQRAYDEERWRGSMGQSLREEDELFRPVVACTVRSRLFVTGITINAVSTLTASEKDTVRRLPL
ncbi:hypothetical protein DFH09DRAFT_1457429 [Mycena vulgaris]|nr:hypothetical protein DFH09DRAFT_1457429 [Mycena vulgaris]